MTAEMRLSVKLTRVLTLTQSLNPILAKVITGSSQKVLHQNQLTDSDMETWSNPDHNKFTAHCAPHALLMRYLEEKIAGFIEAATRRTRI